MFQMQKGFTLIELLITTFVLAILLTMGAPSFSKWIKDARLSTAATNLAGALSLARNEAISRQSTITVASGGNWATGLSIYTDSGTGNSSYSALTDDKIKDLEYQMKGIVASSDTAGTDFISFSSNGLLSEGGSEARIALCDDRGAAEGRLVTVNVVGRTTVEQGLASCTF